MCKCVLVLKITKNLYIVVVMLLCVKIKKNDFSKRNAGRTVFVQKPWTERKINAPIYKHI